MRLMMKNERGFTLIEALISLVIVATLSLISYPFVVNLYDYIRLNQAITIFQADLHYVRGFNMMPLQDQQRMTLRIYHNEDRYVILIGDYIQSERNLPSRVTMPHDNATSDISFNRQGNLGQGKTLLVASQMNERSIVFSVGVGGFDVR